MRSLTVIKGSEPLPGRVELHFTTREKNRQHLCPVYVGTCGYSYTEWIDSGFYPEKTKTPDMLGLYGRCFSVVELNYTWYQMARAEALSRMVEKAHPNLLFCAKLTRTMTHDRDPEWREQLRLYKEGVAPLQSRLGAILVQLPPDFDRTVANRKYLARLLDELHPLPLAVEFRHRSWAADSVFKELEKRKVCLVTVDEPSLPGLFPSLDVVTNPELFYVRFHGRNRKGWFSGNMQEKFHYDYSAEELSHWSEKFLLPMASRAACGIVLFNNHVRAYAPRNGQSLLTLLRGRPGGC